MHLLLIAMASFLKIGCPPIFFLETSSVLSQEKEPGDDHRDKIRIKIFALCDFFDFFSDPYNLAFKLLKFLGSMDG